MEIHDRFKAAQLVREHYPEFVDFCRDAMQFLGFNLTWMQEDICKYMQYGGQLLAVQAQRGEAKSTIACIFAVWKLVQDPTYRVLLISGSGEKATENAVLIQGLIRQWEVLAYLRPDRNAGDRSAVNSFDVHWTLKGVDKSPSVRCMGITASLQGYRADLLIPDDIETNKNSLSAPERAKILALSKEFTSIVADISGIILYLGTPQTKDSIYNSLPGRGFNVCIWPGRFPTADQVAKYGTHLAPSILKRLELLGTRCQTGGGLSGTMGWPTDPQRMSEEELCVKELDQGIEGFELQFMLNTDLSDAMRQQLKLRDLLFVEMQLDTVPEQYVWQAGVAWRYNVPNFPVLNAELYTPSSTTGASPLQAITMAIDPAGSGGDELAFAIGAACGSYVHLLAVGGYQGGLCDDNLAKLVRLCKEYKVTNLIVERNMGHGTATSLILNYFHTEIDGQKRLSGVGVTDVYSTGQKERRIIDTLQPLMRRHRLIVHQSAVAMDLACNARYAAIQRDIRSVFYQMQNITTDRGSLEKDDRIDVLAILVQQLNGFLVIDEAKAERRRQDAAIKEFINNPLQRPSSSTSRRGHRVLRKRGLQ